MAGEINWGLLDTSLPQKAFSSYADGQKEQAQNALAAAQLQSAQRQNKLADLAMADDQATRAAYQSSGGDMNKALGSLQQGGQYKAAMDLQAKMSAQQKEALATKKAELENHLKKFEVIGQVMSGVTDQPSYDAARQQMAQIIGPEAANQAPPSYDPSFIEKQRTQAMSVKDQLANQWKSIDAQLNREKFGYQQKNDVENRNVQLRGQNISAGNAAASRNQAERHFQATQGAPVYNSDAGGFIVKPSSENPTGKIIPVESAGSNKPLTEAQGNATAFALRAGQALQELGAIKGDNGEPYSPGYVDRTLAKTPFGLGNPLLADKSQQFVNAEKNYIAAVLRKESGAAIAQSEYDSYGPMFFPRPGDSKDVLAQKTRARALAEETLKVQAGPQYEKLEKKARAAAGLTKPERSPASNSGATVSNW